jgi:hypothetical protein
MPKRKRRNLKRVRRRNLLALISQLLLWLQQRGIPRLVRYA